MLKTSSRGNYSKFHLSSERRKAPANPHRLPVHLWPILEIDAESPTITCLTFSRVDTSACRVHPPSTSTHLKWMEHSAPRWAPGSLQQHLGLSQVRPACKRLERPSPPYSSPAFHSATGPGNTPCRSGKGGVNLRGEVQRENYVKG